VLALQEIICRKRDTGERQFQVPITVTGQEPPVGAKRVRETVSAGEKRIPGIVSDSAASQGIHHPGFRQAAAVRDRRGLLMMSAGIPGRGNGNCGISIKKIVPDSGPPGINNQERFASGSSQ